MSSPVILSLDKLTLRYGPMLAVDGLSLAVRAGEVYGLLGPNGSGKSSTLSAIAGTLTATSGDIRVLGMTRQDNPRRYLHGIGVVPQQLALYEELNALDNLRFFGRLYGLGGSALEQHVSEALEFVQLTEHARKRVATLSGGMQRRLNLACALLHRPALLLLDEPTVGVDVAVRDAIFDSLRELKARGCALVFTSHHLHEVEMLCDRVGLMDRGRLVAEGTLDDLEAAVEPFATTHRPRLEHVYLQLTSNHEVRS